MGDKIEEDTHFKVIETEETEYFYEIYNTDGKLVKSGKSYRTELMINYIDPETIEILIAAGTDTFYCIYYDIVHDKFSEQYDSPIAAKYNKVAFLDHRDASYQSGDSYEEKTMLLHLWQDVD